MRSARIALSFVIPTRYIGKDSFIRKESTDGQEKSKEEGYQEEGYKEEGYQEEGNQEESHQEESHAQEEGYEEESHQEEKGQSPKKVAYCGLGHYLCRALPPPFSRYYS